MKKLKLFTIVAVFCVGMFGVTSANAGYLPYEISNIGAFLGNTTYFNGYSAVGSSTFSGDWQYTAIAYEAGNVNITENAIAGPTTFSTAALGNWGTWRDVDFDTTNIYFSDNGNGPINVAFNPYSPSIQFRLFQLTGNSNTLGYLANPLSLSQGTYIIGWNDNTVNQSNDGDYDDIIVAMRAKPVPEPTSMLLLGLGLVGLAGMARRFKR